MNKANSNSNEEFLSVLDSMDNQNLGKLQRKEVQDIMSKDVVTINPEETMAEALTVMVEKNIGSLIVTKYDAPVGIVTESDLLSKVLALGKDLRETTVEAVMSYPLIAIAPNVKIKEAAKLMIRQNVRRLAIFEVGKLVGIVTAVDIVRSMPDFPKNDAKVDDFMTKRVQFADEKTPVSRIVEIMSEKHIGSIIVTHKGEPFGIFTERDLLTTFLAKGRHGGVLTEEDMLSTFFVKGKPLLAEVGKEASLKLITAPVGTSIQEAAAIMTTKHVRRLPIEKDGKMVGIITATDLVEAFAG